MVSTRDTRTSSLDLSTCMLPIILQLRVMGCCPLQVVCNLDANYSKYDHKKIVYKSKMFSLASFYTMAIILVYFLLGVVMIFRDSLQGRYRTLVGLETYEFVIIPITYILISNMKRTWICVRVPKLLFYFL